MFRFAVTIFVSAFLLFQVQPLIGRFILPWFGGGPSIWTSCMLFFQILLLGGYLYAHLISINLRLRTQVMTHLSLLTASLFFLPISPTDSWKPASDQSPLLQILLLLLATVGGPYFMLSSTGPLMQKWFSHASPGKSPYRLYALSNIGSLLALLSYPFVFEPWLTLHQQVSSWSMVYVAYVALAAWCAIPLWKIRNIPAPVFSGEDISKAAATVTSDTPDVQAVRPGIGTLLLWLGLAACSSAMLLSTTNQLCIDVATVPFLWVLPLSLYLISFIICFDSPQWYDRRAYGMLLLLCAPIACWLISEGADVNITKQVVLYSTILFACCMTCHGELVGCKPHPKYLTLFYVLISAGGALGGTFVAIVAPYLFHGYWEYHISLVACCAMTLIAWCTQRIWLQKPSAEFWCCAAVVIGHIAVVWHYVYAPFSDFINATNETTLFGVYAAIHFLGLLITGVLTQRPRLQMIAWIVLFVVSSAWLLGFSRWKFPTRIDTQIQTVLVLAAILSPITTISLSWLCRKLSSSASAWRFFLAGLVHVAASVVCGFLFYQEWNATNGMPDVQHQRMYLFLMAVAALSPLAVAGHLWLSGFQEVISSRFLTLGLIYPLMSVVAGGLYYLNQMEDWQAISLLFTTAAGLMMEWSSSGFRGPQHASLGFWFWVPSITLLLLLSNRLAEIVTSDNESTASISTIHTSRNFYGVLRVRHEAAEDDDGDFIPAKNALTHGQIRHGFQFDDDYWKRQPTTYYGRESGIGLAILNGRQHAHETDQHALRVGVVGLGTGTIAAYGEPGEYFRFYDINPDVAKLSDTIFTYLKDTPAKTEVVIGDARIVMEREIAAGQNQQFDVLAIDAFSSDAIPVHLLTNECGDIYRQHLRPGGILAIHISNRFLDLNPVSRGMADHLGWQAIRIENGNDNLTGVFSSTWILLTSRKDLITDPDIEEHSEPWLDEDPILHWTDDYSGLWQILTF